jgi:hypothetical protein
LVHEFHLPTRNLPFLDHSFSKAKRPGHPEVNKKHQLVILKITAVLDSVRKILSNAISLMRSTIGEKKQTD